MAFEFGSSRADSDHAGVFELNAGAKSSSDYSAARNDINFSEGWHKKSQEHVISAPGKASDGEVASDYFVSSSREYSQLKKLPARAIMHIVPLGSPFVGWRIQNSQENSAHAPSGAQIEIANLFNNLKRDWDLSNAQMARLLGLDNISGEQYVKNLLSERCSFDGRDVKDRMARLIEIREILFALFRNHEIENLWLRGKQKTLGDKAPMDLMLEGTMANFWRAEGFIKETAGR